METKTKIYIILAVFGLASLALVVFLIWPVFQSIEEKSNELLSEKNELFYLEDQVAEVENFKKNYESYKENLEKIDTVFVNSKNPVDFIKFLEQTAEDSALKSEIFLSAANISKDNKNTASPFISFQIITDGSFSNTIKFSEKLETGPYLLKIQNLTVKKSEEISSKKSSTQNIRATFLINVFVKNNER